MAIDATSKTQAPAVPPAAASPANPSAQLGKQDFMKLLVAQLKNQDPLNPMDSKEMISQLATLTSVEKLSSVDQSLTQLRAETTGMAGMQATALIGRKVTAEANHLTVNGLGRPTAPYKLDAAADSVKLTVRNAEGNIVRTLELGPQAPGEHVFSWDGVDDAAQNVANGTYTFEIAAKSSAGQPVPATSRVTGPVSEVSFKNGKAELVIGNASVTLGDVISIVQ